MLPLPDYLANVGVLSSQQVADFYSQAEGDAQVWELDPFPRPLVDADLFLGQQNDDTTDTFNITGTQIRTYLDAFYDALGSASAVQANLTAHENELIPLADPHGLKNTGDGSLFLSDDGTYKAASGGGGSPGGTVEGAVQLRNADGSGFSAFDNLTFDGTVLSLLGKAHVTAATATDVGLIVQTSDNGTANGAIEILASDDSQLLVVSPGGKLTLDVSQSFGTDTGIAFGDGDTAIFEQSDDNLYFRSGGSNRFFISGPRLGGLQTNTAELINEIPSATNPVFRFPFRRRYGYWPRRCRSIVVDCWWR